MNENQTNSNLIPEQDKKAKSLKKIILIALPLIIVISIILYYFYNKVEEERQKELIELSIEERKMAFDNLFSVSEYNAIPENYKEHIYNFMLYNGFLDGTYFLTKIADRATKVFAFGDFTNDDNDEDDMAILFENSDFKSSKLVIFNHKGELLFVEDYEYDLPTINSFKVGSKIYLDEVKLVPSPNDGLIVKTQYNKKAVVYDKKSKKFNTYHQYTQEEIDSMDSDTDYYEGEYYEESPPEPDITVQDDNFTIQEVK